MSVTHRIQGFAQSVERRLRTRHVHGPKLVQLEPCQFMAVCLAKDASYFMGDYIEHHLSIGASHVLVVDNGSTDDTASIARTFGERATVIMNIARAANHESQLRSEISQQIARGGWLLFADADEMVEFPAPAPTVLAYCEREGYTAAIGQMLDMFSERRQADLINLPYRDAVRAFDRYSLAAVENIAYHASKVPFSNNLRSNRCDDGGVQLKIGGVRSELFSESPFLSKHSLVRNQPAIRPMTHPHAASDVVVADLTLLVRHYKFAGDWQARDRRSVAERHWEHGEDRKRLSNAPLDRFAPPAAQVWSGLDALQRSGFLYCSDKFKDSVANVPAHSGADAA